VVLLVRLGHVGRGLFLRQHIATVKGTVITNTCRPGQGGASSRPACIQLPHSRRLRLGSEVANRGEAWALYFGSAIRTLRRYLREGANFLTAAPVMMSLSLVSRVRKMATVLITHMPMMNQITGPMSLPEAA
jgi:hypothetical protein